MQRKMNKSYQENDKIMNNQLFNDTLDYAEVEKQYFTFENNERDSSQSLHDNEYEKAGIFSRIFFNWVSPTIKVRKCLN